MTRWTWLRLLPAVLIVLSVTSFAQYGPSPAPTSRSQYSRLAAERAQGHVRQESDTWYEIVLKRFNPHNIDYGSRIEERRRAFLDATVDNPYFPYSAVVTLWCLFLMAYLAKRWIDEARKARSTADMVADLYNHDQHSREAAREAIEKYNQHIEQCNRAIEDGADGHSPSGGLSETDELKGKLKKTADELQAVTRERDVLRDELAQKSRVVTNLSLRVQALTDQINGNGNAPALGAAEPLLAASNTEYMKLINSLQQQLYAERDKNRHIKGA